MVGRACLVVNYFNNQGNSKCEKPIIKDDEFEILCHDCYHITGIDLKELIDFDGLLYLPLNTISGATDFHKVISNGEVKITHYYRMLDYLPIVSLKGTINKQSFVFTIPAKFIIFMHPNMPYQYRWNEKKQDFIKEPK